MADSEGAGERKELKGALQLQEQAHEAAHSELALSQGQSFQVEKSDADVVVSDKDKEKEPFTKYEFDMFRDVLSNVNNTLRFQLSLNVPLLAACITVLNIV